MSSQMDEATAVQFGQNPPDVDPRETLPERPTAPLSGSGLPGFEADPHVTGPALAETETPSPDLIRASDMLVALGLRDYRIRENDTRVNFAFDVNGDVKVVLYVAPQGNVSKLTRVCIDVAGFTPAAPFAAAAAWAGIYRGQGAGGMVLPYQTGLSAGEHDAALGNLFDFAPVASGAPMFPGLFEYNEASAPRVWGPSSFVLFVKGTAALAGKQGTAYVRAVDVIQL